MNIQPQRRIGIIICAYLGIIVPFLVAVHVTTSEDLFSIVKRGDVNALKSAVSPHNVNSTDILGWTPLMYAATAGNYEACRILIANGADPTKKDRKGFSALEYVNMTLRLSSEHDETEEYLKKQGIHLPIADPSKQKTIDMNGLLKVKQMLESAATRH